MGVPVQPEPPLTAQGRTARRQRGHGKCWRVGERAHHTQLDPAPAVVADRSCPPWCGRHSRGWRAETRAVCERAGRLEDTSVATTAQAPSAPPWPGTPRMLPWSFLRRPPSPRILGARDYCRGSATERSDQFDVSFSLSVGQCQVRRPRFRTDPCRTELRGIADGRSGINIFGCCALSRHELIFVVAALSKMRCSPDGRRPKAP